MLHNYSLWQAVKNCSTTCNNEGHMKKRNLVLLLKFTSWSHNSWGSSQKKSERRRMKHHKSYWRPKGHRHIFLIYHWVKHRTFFKICNTFSKSLIVNRKNEEDSSFEDGSRTSRVVGLLGFCNKIFFFYFLH